MTRDEIEAMRLAAAKDLSSGMSQGHVARKYGVTRTTASRWARTLKTEGIEAMRKHNGAGRPCRLTPYQLAAVVDMQSFPFAKLTGKGLAEAIESAWGVCYHPDHMYKLGKPSPPRQRRKR